MQSGLSAEKARRGVRDLNPTPNRHSNPACEKGTRVSCQHAHHRMIVRNTRSSLWRCQIALQPSRAHYDSTRLAFCLPQSRKFHASRPNLIVNEALQLSSEAFYFVHDTTGLAWGLSIPVTAALCQFAFTPLHYIVERNRKLRAQGANLLVAWQTIYRERALAQQDERPTEFKAASAESEIRKQLKAKGKQIKTETGYMGNWLSFTLLSYIPVWISNVSALIEMCGLSEKGSKVVSASGTNGVAIEPGLTTDGMLWFSDLTIADPWCMLQIAAGGLFIGAVKQIERRRIGPPTFLHRLISMIALISGPMFIATGVSNAVILAMIGSTAVTIVRRSVLDKVLGTTVAAVKPAQPRTAVLKKQYRLDTKSQV